MTNLELNCSVFGLSSRDCKQILGAISKFKEIRRAVIYGSRAMDNYKNGSDVDIAIFGEEITFSIVVSLSTILNQELPLAYFFDVIDYKEINSSDLVRHIDSFGKTFYERHSSLDELNTK